MKKIFLFSIISLVALNLTAQNFTTNTKYKSHVIKTSFFAPLFNHLEFGYEQSLNNKAIFDGSLGIIGVGVGQDTKYDNSAGLYVKSGVKFFFNPDFVVDGLTRYNDFQGTYFEPQLIIGGFSGSYSQDQYDPYYWTYLGTKTVDYSVTDWAFNLIIGKQYVLANTLSLNGYGGLGYGGSTGDHNYSDMYSHMGGSADSTPLTVTGGVSIGVLF